MQKIQKKADIKVETTTGSVFHALGYPDAAERVAKANLMMAINREIKLLGLTQVQAAARTGLSQSDISNISRGRGLSFALGRLIGALNKLGIEAEINLHRGNGGIVVRELAG